MIVAGVSGVLLLLALVSGGSSPSDRKRDASDTQRSRSPKGKDSDLKMLKISIKIGSISKMYLIKNYRQLLNPTDN